MIAQEKNSVIIKKNDTEFHKYKVQQNENFLKSYGLKQSINTMEINNGPLGGIMNPSTFNSISSNPQ